MRVGEARPRPSSDEEEETERVRAEGAADAEAGLRAPPAEPGATRLGGDSKLVLLLVLLRRVLLALFAVFFLGTGGFLASTTAALIWR